MNKTRIDSKTLADPPTLIFLHVPKTAGRTFYNILIRQFSPSEILRVEHFFSKDPSIKNQPVYQFFNPFLRKYAIDCLGKIPDEQKIRIKCITQGHLAFGLHTHFPQRVSYITFLRNPIDRVISQYYYLRRRPNNPFYYLVKGKDLKEYIKNEEISDQVSNVQVRFLCGEDGIPKQGKLSEEDLKLAKERLKKYFAFVGITEKFDESLICLKRIFGWGNVFYYKSNISKDRPSLEEIPKDTIQIIQKKNELDTQLYKFAEQILENLVYNYGSSFEADLRAFQKRLPVFGKLLYLKRIITASPKMYKDKLLIKLGEIKAKYDNFFSRK
jgi:hypothetical protein